MEMTDCGDAGWAIEGLCRREGLKREMKWLRLENADHYDEGIQPLNQRKWRENQLFLSDWTENDFW
jgi:hypothetical protein